MRIDVNPTLRLMEIGFGKSDLELTHRWPTNDVLAEWGLSPNDVKVTHIEICASLGWGLEVLRYVLANGNESVRAGVQNSKVRTIAITSPISEISMKNGTYGILGLKIIDINGKEIFNQVI